MATAPLDYTSLFRAHVPPPAARWAGSAEHNFTGGHNDPEIVPLDGLIESANRVLREQGRELSLYNLDGGPQGVLGLRRFLVDKLAARRGVRATTDDILITSGSMQAIDLINQLMLQPGDTVITEQFTYQGCLNDWLRRRVEVVGIPLDQDGLRLDLLANALDQLKAKGVRPKYIYTIPTVQNPTGSVLPLARRHELLRLAQAFGVPILEDECYADLLWQDQHPPALYGLDPANHVIHIGSFSKSLAPALRLGYVVARWEVMSRLLALKMDAGSCALSQLIVADFFGAHFDGHVATLNAGLQRKLDALTAALDKHFGAAAEYTRPQGGIFLWVKLPAAVDTAKLAAAALADGVAINPGPEWSADAAAARHHLRLCFALPSADQIEAGIAKLAEVCHRETGVPARSANIPRG